MDVTSPNGGGGPRPLRIALVGTRGIPANYGGFETFAEELGTRLASRGHEITVYCRKHYSTHPESVYRGVHLAVLPAIRHKYFDTLSHTFLSVLHLLPERPDVVLACNAANACFCLLPRLVGSRVVLNVDGLERKRRKWNALARLHYRVSEMLSCVLPTAIVTDADVIRDYYRDHYGRSSTMIPYGAEAFHEPPGAVLETLGLGRGDYFLYVSRLEPENNALLVIRAFEHVKTDKRLLVVGDAPYAAEYVEELHKTQDPRVIFTGAVYGKGYRELTSNAYCYIQATEVGGTHPALIENMAQGTPILYLDTPENIEVAGGAGLPFPHDPLAAAAVFQSMADNPLQFRVLQEKALAVVRERYSWDSVVDRYLDLFYSLLPPERLLP